LHLTRRVWTKLLRCSCSYISLNARIMPRNTVCSSPNNPQSQSPSRSPSPHPILSNYRRFSAQNAVLTWSSEAQQKEPTQASPSTAALPSLNVAASNVAASYRVSKHSCNSNNTKLVQYRLIAEIGSFLSSISRQSRTMQTAI